MVKTDRVFDVLKEIEMGFIPYEFTFNLEPRCQIDWTRLKYDDWTDNDFWLNKMPDGLLEQFPCLFDWALSICEENKKTSPLQELEARGSKKVELVEASISDQ